MTKYTGATPVYLRFGDGGGEIILTGRPPISHDEYLRLCRAVIDMERDIVDTDELAQGVTT